MTGVHGYFSLTHQEPPLDNIKSVLPPHDPPHVLTGGTMPYNGSSGTTNSSHDSGDTNNPPDVGALIQTPLQPGKTLIIYHPHAQCPPEVINTNTLLFTREPQPSLLPSEPWAPFTSRDDFEQAEFFIKHGCTNSMINDQLRLNQRRDLCCHGPGVPPSMRNACEMHKTFEEAVSDLDISSACGFILTHHLNH